MGGKTKSSSSSTQTNSAYEPVKPVIDQGASVMSGYLSDPNSNAVYSGPRVADMSSDTLAGIGAMRDSSGAATSSQYLKDMLGSGSGSMNPQVQQMQDAIRRQVQAATNAQFSQAGMTGGTQHQGSMAKGLADGMAQPLFAAYENDMQRKMQAAGLLPQVDQQAITNRVGAGQIRDSYAQNKINADMQAFNENRTAPMKAWSEVAPLAMQMGSTFGTQKGQSTQTQSQSQSPLSMIGGAAMAGAGLLSGNPMMALNGASSMFGGGGGAANTTPWNWNMNPSTFTNFSNQYTPGEVLPWRR